MTRYAPSRRLLLASGLAGGLLAATGATNARAEDDLCPVVSSQDWEAWLARTPYSGDRLMLHVRGIVSMPTPGYAVSLREGPMTRSFPPTQMLVLEARPPLNEIAAQVIATSQVSVILPGQDTYKAVRVVCGKELLHEFTEVPVFR